MHPTRQAPRSSMIHRRAIVAAVLVLGLVLAIAAVAWAVPSVSIDAGPSGPTNDARPQFGFTVDVGATVECSIDEGTPTYGSCSGAATHQPAVPLADGAYVFRVRATDAAEETVASRAFSVDTAQPTLSIDAGPSGPTNDTTPSFGFTAEPGATVECSIDEGTPAYGGCSEAATHQPAVPLADGGHVFRVRATDAAGNQAEASQAFVVDTVAPAVGGISGPAGPTNDTTPLFGFTAEPGASVECSIDHGTPAYGPCATTTSHTAVTALADGSYVFRVRATDAAGNAANAQQAFSIDSTAPSLSIDAGPAGPTNDTTPSFAFTAEAGTTVECSIDQGTPAYGPCRSATTYVVGTPLPEGSYVFRVRATDRAANQAIVSSAFTVDTTPPSPSIGFGPTGTTSDNTPLFGFSVDAGATVECSIDQGAPAYGPCASPTTHAAVAPLVDGAYVFRLRATDGAGNQTIVARAFAVDTVPQAADPGSPTPTPPAAPPATPTPSEPRLLSPFPLVRISGTLTPTGARISRLSVRAPHGALVRVAVRPPCSRKRRPSRRCHVLRAARTVGGRALIRFRGLARTYRSGTVIVVRVWGVDRIGKYTRFTIVRGKAPRRVDQCLLPGATRGSRCPSE
ncbi:MAG: Ig-like domain-containing protein [Gaiellaceae bacterium]